jgi:hypothetical protein
VQYSATQYAMFSSLMLLFPKFTAGFSASMWTPTVCRIFYRDRLAGRPRACLDLVGGSLARALMPAQAASFTKLFVDFMYRVGVPPCDGETEP